MKIFQDDKYTFLDKDVNKIRSKSRMYISFSNAMAAKAIVMEAIFNAVDEAKNPLSPATKIFIEFNEKDDMITVSDDGRGIPLDLLEELFTTLNSGSNIDSSTKKTNTLGRNGVGTLALCALGEIMEVTSYRGGTEDKMKRLLFHEGEKVEEFNSECKEGHGLTVKFKPSKILGKNTRIIWNDIRDELINLQFLINNKKKISMQSKYINKRGEVIKENYTHQPFENILTLKNGKGSIINDKILISIDDNNIIEEVAGQKTKRFMQLDFVFAHVKSDLPYIDSFCNTNNTIDNGSHLDGVIEAICRYFQQATKATLSERDKLDIKWDDVKLGLSVVVSLNTNMEAIFTSQTKHKVSNEELEKLIKEKSLEALQKYFNNNPNKLKSIITLVKTNAKARREGDKARSAIVKETLTNWSAFKMKNYDPCTNKGKEYKELYIIEGDSAKGSLKLARDPRFQALFAIRGVSANVFKMTLDQIVGPNGNVEFTNLIKVLGCNVGSKFDINKLQFNKICIASDADKLSVGFKLL